MVEASSAALTVRPALEADIEPMVRTLGRAFFEDPVTLHLFSSRLRRMRGLQAFFRIRLRQELVPFGGAFTTGDHRGVAGWSPPGTPSATGLAGLLSMLPVVPYVAGRGTPRALRFLAQMEALRAKEPHWYLAVLGTDPDYQGKGIGGRVLAPVLERCDREGIPARLESSNLRNVPFYRRHGFETEEEVRFSPSAPVLTVMRREPRPPGT